MKNQKGFSLVELLIVVAIIGIIAAIAIPSLLKARKAANEAAAIGNLRSINAAENTYTASGAAPVTLAIMSANGFLDTSMTAGSTHDSYVLTENVDSVARTYRFINLPTGTASGDRGFAIQEDGVIRFSPTGGDPGLNGGTVLGQ